MSDQGVDVQNLIKIDSAVAALRMREKRGLAWFFSRLVTAWTVVQAVV